MRTHLIVAVALLSGGALAGARQVPISYPQPAMPMDGPPVEGVPYGGFASGGRGGGAPGDYIAWVSGGYLVGWIPKAKLPTPLVTTGSTTDAAPGALRQPGTVVLFGDRLDFDPYQGFQAVAGIFCDESRAVSIDGQGFYLFETSQSFQTSSDLTGNPVLARPVYNVITEQEGAFIDARPGFARGSVSIDANSRMWGFEGNARCHVGNDRLRGELLAGFRYLNLEEDLTIIDNVAPIQRNTFTFLGGSNFVNPPNSLIDMDQFTTRNHFYGGQVGGVLVWEDSWWSVRLSGKVGFGLTEQRVSIGGSSTLVTPAGNTVASGGILAVDSNIGSYSRSVFGIVPEWGIQGGVSVTSWMRLTGGYTFMFWNRVVRPGDAIDRGINPSFVPTSNSFGTNPTPSRPTQTFNDGSFWLQAANAGVEFVF